MLIMIPEILGIQTILWVNLVQIKEIIKEFRKIRLLMEEISLVGFSFIHLKEWIIHREIYLIDIVRNYNIIILI